MTGLRKDIYFKKSVPEAFNSINFRQFLFLLVLPLVILFVLYMDLAH